MGKGRKLAAQAFREMANSAYRRRQLSAIYTSYVINPTDTIEQRQAKLYLAVVSLGEVLYQKGAAIAEFNKELAGYEKTIAQMRLDLHKIREDLSV